LDVHDDEGVDERAPGDPAQALLTLLLGEQQDVVVEGASRGDHGDDELHDHRHVDPVAQRDDEREHARAVAGQCAGTGVRLVSQGPDAGLDPAAGVLRDGPLVRFPLSTYETVLGRLRRAPRRR
jgi:hypothetical protein